MSFGINMWIKITIYDMHNQSRQIVYRVKMKPNSLHKELHLFLSFHPCIYIF